MEDRQTAFSNPGCIALAQTPTQDINRMRRTVIEGVKNGNQLLALFLLPAENNGTAELFAVLGDIETRRLSIVRAPVKDSYPSITTDLPLAERFEREIAEQWGVIPTNHPWLKPVRFHESYRQGHHARPQGRTDFLQPGVMDFLKAEGDEIHEVAVGPVHAGIIEPGHFRFLCHGEKILHMEIALGYQHRSVEQALIGGPDKRTIHYMETLAGDTTIGHTLAYCQAVEALSGCEAPLRGQALRAIALELERLANHTGDLGAMAADVGYSPTAAFCGRLRGDFLNLSALLCGNRFGRSLIRPGGVAFDLDVGLATEINLRLTKIYQQVEQAVDLLWREPSVLARFEETGVIDKMLAVELGLVGPAARACGIEYDVRVDFPAGMYRRTPIPVSTWFTGDVYGRAFVRWLEIKRSVNFIRQLLNNLPDGPTAVDPGEIAGGRIAVSLVEGWRGEICHTVVTDERGRFRLYKVVDPSFHNWLGLAMAVRNEGIMDFPICNKSFSLSYCGHDL